MVNVKLKAKMLEKGVSGFQLARAIGMSDSQFSRLVRGWISVPETTRTKLAELLDCPVSTIFADERIEE